MAVTPDGRRASAGVTPCLLIFTCAIVAKDFKYDGGPLGHAWDPKNGKGFVMLGKASFEKGVTCVVASAMALALAGAPMGALAQGATASSGIAIEAQAGEFAVIRLAGADRYETMGKIVGQGFSTSDWAGVATGDDLPDALCAAGLAGSKHAPIVLTQKGGLTAQAAHQLKRMNTKHVFLVDGTKSLSDNVRTDLKNLDISVERITGADRCATSVAVMRMIRKAGSKTDAVVIANGTNYADALSIGSWAHVSASPILLTQADGTLPKATVKAIKDDKGFHRVIIVGGQSAVSDDVLEQLGPDYEYTRLGGANRYETSASIAEWACTHGLSWENVALVTGNNFADALAAAGTMGDPPMGDYHGPVLLVSDTEDPTVKLLQEHAPEVAICFVFGGTASVSEVLADPALYRGVPQQPTAPAAPAPAPVDTPAPTTTETPVNTSVTTNTTSITTSDAKKTNSEVFSFDGFNIQFGNTINTTKLDNQFSDKNGSTVISIPVMITNASEETKSLNMFYVTEFGPAGTELDSVDAYYTDDDIRWGGDLRPGANKTGRLYFLYEGNGDYVIRFQKPGEQATEVKIPVTLS